MSGEPIIYAHNCAFIIVNEPSVLTVSTDDGAKIHDRSIVIADAMACPVLDLSGARSKDEPFFIDKTFVDRIAAMKRRVLILTGALLEGAVTQIALNILLEGFDVFVCVDLVVTEEPDHETMFLERIRSCSGNTVTSRQLIREILSRERDDTRRASLKALLK